MGDGDSWRVHKSEDQTGDEPPGGWVSSSEKIDTEIQALSLCRFSGDQLMTGATCAVRGEGRHPDVDCVTFFISAKAFEEKTLDLSPILSYQRGEVDGAELPMRVVQRWGGGETSGVVSSG